MLFLGAARLQIWTRCSQAGAVDHHAALAVFMPYKWLWCISKMWLLFILRLQGQSCDYVSLCSRSHHPQEMADLDIYSAHTLRKDQYLCSQLCIEALFLELLQRHTTGEGIGEGFLISEAICMHVP